MPLTLAPEIEITDWLNTDTKLSLNKFRGKVIFVNVFQMLCPACVSHSLPQAIKASLTFSNEDLAVIGLHSVFEHHSAQGTREALSAFLHEYKVAFPIAIDAPSNIGATPKTMAKYKMRGTPTTLLIDRAGQLREHSFGKVDDMALGAKIMTMIGEPYAKKGTKVLANSKDNSCGDKGCLLPD